MVGLERNVTFYHMAAFDSVMLSGEFKIVNLVVHKFFVLNGVMLDTVVNLTVEISFVLLRMKISLIKLCKMDVMVLDSVVGVVFHIMEELVELMLHLVHHTGALVEVNVMVEVGIVKRMEITTKLKVSLITVFGCVTVGVVMLVVCMMFVSPVVGTMLDSVMIVVVVSMLGMMLAVISVRVVVAHVTISLRLNIMVLAMLFSSEVTMIVKMRLMILQVPVALLEVSIGVMLVATGQLFHLVLFKRVLVLKGSLFLFVVDSAVSSKVIFSIVGSLLLLLLSWLSCLLSLLFGLLLLLLLLCLFVHLLVEEGGFRAHMLLSFSLRLRWLFVVVRVWLIMIRSLLIDTEWVVSMRSAVSFLTIVRVLRTIRVGIVCLMNCTSFMTEVLLGADVEMLITLPCLLSFHHRM